MSFLLIIINSYGSRCPAVAYSITDVIFGSIILRSDYISNPYGINFSQATNRMAASNVNVNNFFIYYIFWVSSIPLFFGCKNTIHTQYFSSFTTTICCFTPKI